MRENIQYQLWYSFYLGASQILRISSVQWTTSQQTLMSPKLSVQSEVSTDNNILVSVRFEMICKKLFWVERVTDQFKILCRHMFNLLWQLFIWGQLICWLCCNSWPFGVGGFSPIELDCFWKRNVLCYVRMVDSPGFQTSQYVVLGTTHTARLGTINMWVWYMVVFWEFKCKSVVLYVFQQWELGRVSVDFILSIWIGKKNVSTWVLILVVQIL
jgi:hypothetical protein